MNISTTTPTYSDRVQWHYTEKQLKAIREFVETCEMYEKEQGFEVSPTNTLRITLLALLKNNEGK